MDFPFLDWTRPWALASLLLAALVWWRARRAGAETALFSGTLELWRAAAGEVRPRTGAGRRLPPRARWIVAALVLGGVALAGPRAGERQSATWTVLVDASPSMYLPWTTPAGAGTDGGATRLERALAAARLELAQRKESRDRVRWLSLRDGFLEEAWGDEPPEAWRSAPRAPQSPPPWELHDKAGLLWVSDAAPSLAPQAAGACLSGGGPVSGPVTALGTRRLHWDLAELTLDDTPHPRPRLGVPAGLPPSARRVLDAWAAAREVELVAAAGAATELDVAFAQGAALPSDPATFARDGWTWSHSGARAAPRGTPWLSGPGGVGVAWTPGRIELTGGGFSEPAGDAAAFAVSWAELLDRAALPVPGVVSLAERQSAGAEARIAPREPQTASGSGSSFAAAALACLAALAALAALLSGSRVPGVETRSTASV